MASDSDIQFKLGVNLDDLFSGLSKATDGISKATKDMGSSFGGLGKVIEDLKAPLLAFTSLLAGGALFKDIINETITWTGEVSKLSKVLGISTEEASGIGKALGKLGVDTDLYSSAVFKLQRGLKTNKEALEANGVAIRNTRTGEMLPIQEIMMNSINRLNEMSEGYDKNALSILLFGRGAKELQGLLRLTNKRIAEGSEEAKKLGVEVGQNQVIAMRAYKESLHDAKEIFEAISVQIGNKLLPVLTSLGLWFSNEGSKIITPVVTTFELLLNLLKFTTIQIALVSAALYGPLLGAFGKVNTLIQAFALQWNLGVTLPLKNGAALFPTLGNALVGFINPWMVLGAVVIGGGIALEHWMDASNRAAQAHTKLMATFNSNSSALVNYSTTITNLSKVLDNSKASDDEKRKAQEKLEISVKQLRLQYPEYAAMLTDERIKQYGILTVLQNINEAKRIAINLLIKETEGKLALAKVEVAERAGSAAVSQALGNSVWALLQQKRTESATVAAKEYTKSLVDALETLKILQGDGTPTKKTNGKFKEPKEDAKVLGEFKEELELLRKQNIAKLGLTGNFYTLSKAEELKFWEDKLNTSKLTAAQRLEVQKQVETAQKAMSAETLTNEKLNLNMSLEKSKFNFAAKLKLAEDYLALQKTRFAADSIQVKEAEKEIQKIKAERDAAHTKVLETRANITREASLALIDDDEIAAKDKAAHYQISALALLEKEKEFEGRRYDIKRAAIVERIRLIELEGDTVKAEEERQKLAQLDREHNKTSGGIKTNITDQKKQESGSGGFAEGIDQYLEQSKNRLQDYKNMALGVAQSLQTGFASAITNIFSGQFKLSSSLSALYKGLKDTVIKSISDMLAKQAVAWAFEKGKMAWDKITLKEKQTMDTEKQASDTPTIFSGLFSAFASIPFGLGIPLAIMAIAGVMALIKSVTARAVGGLVDTPQLSLVGEAGPEVIAPLHDFKDFARSFVSMGASMYGSIAEKEGRKANYSSYSSDLASGVRPVSQADKNRKETNYNITVNGAIGDKDALSKYIHRELKQNYDENN